MPPSGRVLLRPASTASPWASTPPRRIVRDARDHGVEVRPLDVNHSRWDCTLEPTLYRQTPWVPWSAIRARGSPSASACAWPRGLSKQDAASPLAVQRGEHPYATIEELSRRAGVPVAALERLAEADAFGSMGATAAGRDLGHPRPTRYRRYPLFAASDGRSSSRRSRMSSPMRPGRSVVEDYGSVGLSLPAAPHRLRARRSGAAGDGHGCAESGAVARRAPGHRAGARAGAAEARLGQGRHVHHARGRDRHRQPDRLAQHLRAPTPPRADRQHDRRPRQRCRRKAA